MLLTRIQNPLTILNVLNNLIKRIRTLLPHLIAVPIAAIRPDDIHERRVDLLELLERQAATLPHEHALEVLQLVFVDYELVRAGQCVVAIIVFRVKESGDG